MQGFAFAGRRCGRWIPERLLPWYRPPFPSEPWPTTTTDPPNSTFDAFNAAEWQPMVRVVLRFSGGYSVPEIAEEMDVRPGTVKSLRHPPRPRTPA